MNAYLLRRTTSHGATVTRGDGSALPPLNNEVNHSPDGFEWGYGGSGPAQLAYAIIRDRGVPKDKAWHYYQDFKADHIANLGYEAEIPYDVVDNWLRARGWRGSNA